MTSQHGLFIGLTTLDCIYQAAHPPGANEKVVADKSLIVAGGPATNAAVAFASLGKNNVATLSSVIGEHPLTSVIKEDLQGHGVLLADLDPTRPAPPPVSSIVVTESTGERSVITRNALNLQAPPDTADTSLLENISILLIDGHQMALSAQFAQWAKDQNIPVVVDAGSWKPNFESVLSLADVVIASANFLPPGCITSSEVFAYLKSLGVPQIAITHGADPVLYGEGSDFDEAKPQAIEVPQIRAVDTLGAGDIFHGAFCHFYLTHTFEETLLKASRSASFACQYWGTRDWTKIYRIADEGTDEESENP